MELIMDRASANTAYAKADTARVGQLLANDLFYLLTIGMDRPDADNDFIFARCREIQASPDGHLDLWAREHYKSTIITVALTIQEILRDPELTVGIFSHTQRVAQAFLGQIRREFEGNGLLQEHFPHIAPAKAKAGKGERCSQRQWGASSLTVARKTNPKECTVEAWGLVQGQPTGKHFSLLVYDDVVTPESVSTPDMIRKTTDAWRLSLNLGAHGGRIRMIGTRYHAADTYAEIIRQGSIKPRIHAATVDGTPEGDPVFLDRESLARKRRDMGPYIFACQMLQDPLADNAQGFKAEWFQRLPQVPDGQQMNRYLLVDPANSKKAGSDYTSMWVVGLNTDGNYYVLDGVHDRLNLTERTRLLFELHQKHRPHAVGYERYGIQADIEHIRESMERVNYRFQIIELGGATPKNDRIRKLVPLFEQGRVFFPHRIMKMDCERRAQDLVQDFYSQEYMTFPVSSHDDMLDCLARIVDPALGATFPLLPSAMQAMAGQRAVQRSSLYN